MSMKVAVRPVSLLTHFAFLALCSAQRSKMGRGCSGWQYRGIEVCSASLHYERILRRTRSKSLDTRRNNFPYHRCVVPRLVRSDSVPGEGFLPG